MAGAYTRLVSARPETLLMQMQGYVVVAAETEGDDQTGELVRPAGAAPGLNVRFNRTLSGRDPRGGK
jgi:hypothetical protein